MFAPRAFYCIGTAALALVMLCAGSGCQMMQASNQRNWSADQAVLSSAEIHGPWVTVHNIRNCDYRSETDYTVRHYDKTFNLNALDSVWFVVVPFPQMASLAHTMLSFGFADRDYLCVSVEIRKEQGETYAPLKGTMRQFELMYVVGDERDLIGLRTNYRLNEVYLYQARATPDQAQRLFLDVMHRVNKLAREPEFYNTLTNNCTTNIVRHINNIAPETVKFNYRVLLPGYSDRLAYDLGLLESSRSFEETRLRSRINAQAYAYRASPEFSQAIRR